MIEQILGSWTLLGGMIAIHLVMNENIRSMYDVSRANVFPYLYRLITSGFVHDGAEHLLYNVIFCAGFFTFLEKLIGHTYLIIFFVTFNVLGYSFSLLTMRGWCNLPREYMSSLSQCGSSPATYGLGFYFALRRPNENLGYFGFIAGLVGVILNFIVVWRTENYRRLSLSYDQEASLHARGKSDDVNASRIPQSMYMFLTQMWTSAFTVCLFSINMIPAAWLAWLMCHRTLQLLKVQGPSGTAHAAHFGGAVTGFVAALLTEVQPGYTGTIMSVKGPVQEVLLSQQFRAPIASLILLFTFAFFENRIKKVLPSSWFQFKDSASMKKSLLLSKANGKSGPKDMQR